MNGFEIVMEAPSKPRVGANKNDAQHAYKDVRSDNIGNGVLRGLRDELLRRNGSVKKVPSNSSHTAATVESAVMEDLGELTTDVERKGLWCTGKNLVKEIDKVLLAKQNRDHDIDRSSITDVRKFGTAVGMDCKADQSKDICHENQGKGLAVGSEEVVYVWSGWPAGHNTQYYRTYNADTASI